MFSIRRFRPGDEEKVSEMIVRTLREVNIKDYPAEYIEETVSQMQPEHVLARTGWTHFYVAEDGNTIVGCGAIGPYWDREDESSLFTIFVSPEYRGRGVGTLVMNTLEADEYFLRADRVEIPASVTGCSFYQKFGYTYKGGVTEPDGEGLIRLEKVRKRTDMADSGEKKEG